MLDWDSNESNLEQSRQNSVQGKLEKKNRKYLLIGVTFFKGDEYNCTTIQSSDLPDPAIEVLKRLGLV